MDFDWNTISVELGEISRKEVEEAFEDPFNIRLLPDIDDVPASEARYFILGKAVSARPIFSVFWTDGKRYRVIAARLMTDAELGFYERKNAELGV